MEYRQLGDSGLKVSALCMGTMQFGWTADEATSVDILSRAHAEGINFIDTADVYSRWVEGNPGGIAEAIIGRWIKRERVPRQDLILATKVRARTGEGPNDEGLSRKHIIEALEASLGRLQTDYIDLYQFHAPDENTPIEESLRALRDLVQQGKVRYIGCSNFKAWQLMQALWTSDVGGYPRMTSLQPHYNLVHREEYERELEIVCRTYGIGVIPYSPLAGGFLTGKYQPGVPNPEGSRGASSSRIKAYLEDDSSLAQLRSVSDLAKRKGRTPSQIALRWLLQRPGISSPIIGPRNLEQLLDNLGSLAFDLDSVEIAEMGRSTG